MFTPYEATYLATHLIESLKTTPSLLDDPKALGALLADTTIPPMPEEMGTSANFLFVLKPHPLTAHSTLLMESLGDCQGLTCEVNTEERGKTVLRLWDNATSLSLQEVEQLGATLQQHLQDQHNNGAIGKPVGYIAWKSHPDAKRYAGNFLYEDSNQRCTASLDPFAWKKRQTLNVADEDALLFLAEDIEIPTYIRRFDITIEDVCTEFSLYEAHV